MTETVLARLARLKSMPITDLKQHWRDLFDAEPPVHNRAYIESRLTYRIQELAYGGLTPVTVERLNALADRAEAEATGKRRQPRSGEKPIAGTRLVREWQGVEHTVTVTRDGYEWQGRPYASLSSVARAITGTRWNGWIFFGLKNHGSGA